MGDAAAALHKADYAEMNLMVAYGRHVESCANESRRSFRLSLTLA